MMLFCKKSVTRHGKLACKIDIAKWCAICRRHTKVKCEGNLHLMITIFRSQDTFVTVGRKWDTHIGNRQELKCILAVWSFDIYLSTIVTVGRIKVTWWE